MKAIQIIKPFDLEITDIEKPEQCAPDEVIIRVVSGGICGSDIGIFNGTNSLATYPRIIGHEFGGYIEKTGTSADGLKTGMQVAVDPVVSCGTCYACRIGRHNVCSTLEVIGVHRDGGFRQYVNVPAKNVHVFHKKMDDGLLCMVEPFSIGMEINNRAQIGKDDKVLIMGAGPIGICAMQVAKSRGAAVLISDIVKARLQRATAMGADAVVLSSEENLEKRVLDFTNHEGMPVIIDTACLPATFEQSIQLASPAGRVVVIGLKNKPSSITMADITKKELTIVGSRLNCNCFDQVMEGFENGALHPELVKTDEFRYLDAQAAFDKNINHPEDVLKVVLRFD